MGLTGIETTVPFFYSAATDRSLSLYRFAAMTAANPARIFGLDDRKGTIKVGLDADLAFYADRPWIVRGEAFKGRGTWSPYEGMACGATVARTMVRGSTVQLAGEARVAPGFGRYLPRRAAVA
jgi:dihydroorotase-like cyclic amidohydrolase